MIASGGNGIAPFLQLAIGWGLLSAVFVWAVATLAHLPLFDLGWIPLTFGIAAAVVFGGFSAASVGGFQCGVLSGFVCGICQAAILALPITADRPDSWWWVALLLTLSAGLGGLGGALSILPTWRGAAARDASANVEPSVDTSADATRFWGLSPFAAASLGAAALLMLSTGTVVAETGEALAAVGDLERSLLWPLLAWTGSDFAAGIHGWLDALAGLTVLVFAFDSLSQRRKRVGRALPVVVVFSVVVWLAQSSTGGLLGAWLPYSSSSWLWLSVHSLTRPLLLVLVVWCLLVGEQAHSLKGARLELTGYDRLLASLALVLLLSQATLGGLQRALESLVIFHLLFGVGVVLPVIVHLAIRGWLMNRSRTPKRLLGHSRCSVGIGLLMLLQMAVGVAAFAAPQWVDWGPIEGLVDLSLTTLHQVIAVALLGLASLLAQRSWQREW